MYGPNLLSESKIMWSSGLNVCDKSPPPTGTDPKGGASGARPPKIGKNMIFLPKILIFHTKYPQNFPSIFLSAPPPSSNLKFWIRPCPTYKQANNILVLKRHDFDFL